MHMGMYSYYTTVLFFIDFIISSPLQIDLPTVHKHIEFIFQLRSFKYFKGLNFNQH